DCARLHLTIAEAAHLVCDTADGLIQLVAGDRPLLERFLHARTQLRLVVGLAAAIALDHQRHDEFGGLEGREPLAAREALAAAADLPAFAGETRVGYFCFNMAAERTVHDAAADLCLRRRTPESA